MKVLLDTNILIHREATVVVQQDIGRLFYWLDELNYQKCIHPASIEEISVYKGERILQTFMTKLESYHVLQIESEMSPDVQIIYDQQDKTDNDRRDTRILNELICNRVDLVLTEDRGIHLKSEQLKVSEKVFTIDGFLEKAISENPQLTDYKVLSVEKTIFGRIDLHDTFFNSFRDDYPGFDDWFTRKSEEPCYVCKQGDSIAAFLYLKIEDENEPYPDITPTFHPMRRLKIGTFKVILNGYKLGERFLKIIFDNAITQKVHEIYVTIFPKSIEQERLIKLLEDFGFIFYGHKANSFGDESIYVRNMSPQYNINEPLKTFPYFGRTSPVYIVPIYPNYHTELLPDSILNTESPADFKEQKPHRNAIRKVYISRSYFRDLNVGDGIIFYRTGGYHKSVLTTLGVVERVYRNIPNEETFISLCRKRSVFSDQKLVEHWKHSSYNRPFIVEFLYTYSFPKRPNLATLIQNKIIKDVHSAPRGFERITNEQFERILQLAQVNEDIIID